MKTSYYFIGDLHMPNTKYTYKITRRMERIMDGLKQGIHKISFEPNSLFVPSIIFGKKKNDG